MNIIHRLDQLPEPERVVFATSYREQVLQALGIAQSYDGSEVKYQELTRVLIAFESWLKGSLGITTERRISHRSERKLSSLAFDGKQHIAIDDILELSVKRFSQVLQGESVKSLEDFLRSLSIHSIELPGVILPPGEQKIPEGHGGATHETFEVKFQQRLSQFINLLQSFGIFTDDITVYHGKISNQMMRQASYNMVDIPRLKKQVLLCDQVGEATFVVNGRLPRGVLLTLTKEQLQERYPDLVTRVEYTSATAWEEQLTALLFSDGIGTKVDVRDQEALRMEIMKLVPTAEEWAGMKAKEKAKLKITNMNMGLMAIARRFGVNGDPINHHKVHLELGRKIYGEHEVLQEISLDDVKKDILDQRPTAAAWAGMKRKEKGKFKITNTKIGLMTIAAMFGVSENPVNNHKYHLELGRKIYGESEELKYEEKPEISNEDLIVAIKVIVPTAAAWAGMKKKEKAKFKITNMNMGLMAIAGRLGVNVDPLRSHEYHLELGRKIYGEQLFALPTEPTEL